MNYSNGQCEVITVCIKSIGTIITVIYCPPDSNYENFKDIIDKVKDRIERCNNNNPMISENIIKGDLNFPNNDWINNSYPKNDSAEAKQTKLILD